MRTRMRRSSEEENEEDLRSEGERAQQLQMEPSTLLEQWLKPATGAEAPVRL